MFIRKRFGNIFAIGLLLACSAAAVAQELELGVVLLSNGSSSTARAAVMNTVVRSFMPVEQVDWVKLLTEEIEARKQKEKPVVATEVPALETTETCCVPVLSQFAGRYRDPWFGDIIIRLKDGQLYFSAEKSPKRAGVMNHHDGSRFVVRWTDRTLEADAYVLFERGQNDRVVGISMTKLDPGDFDFEDLNLSRLE